jgi:hypothetical protein
MNVFFVNVEDPVETFPDGSLEIVCDCSCSMWYVTFLFSNGEFLEIYKNKWDFSW